MRQCYCANFTWNIYEDITKPIPWIAIGHNCKELHCYNGHAWLALGDIPELKAPTYGELRNRVCADGSEWLQPQMKAFMNTKLYQSNEEYGLIKKLYVDIRNRSKVAWKSTKRIVKRIAHIK